MSTTQNRAEELCSKIQVVGQEIRRVIVGMEEPIESVLLALVAGGHLLLQGPFGLAKTKLSSAMAHACTLTFGRVQGQPGTTPEDILGHYLPRREGREGEYTLEFYRGPVFSNVLLTDELNRISTKGQAGYIEPMEEHRVTTPYGGERLRLPKPFFHFATQNVHEIGSGTFPLLGAVNDRFQSMVEVVYPTEEEENRIGLQDDEEPKLAELKQHLTADEIIETWKVLAEKYPSRDQIKTMAYIVRLVRATRPNPKEQRQILAEHVPSSEEEGPFFLHEAVEVGAGPRAVKHLFRMARAHAFLSGDSVLTPQHVTHVAQRVLAHRTIISHLARARGMSSRNVVDSLLATVPEKLHTIPR